MLFTLLAWILIGALSAAYGLGALRLTRRLFNLADDDRLDFPLVACWGVAVITALGEYVSLFARLNVEGILFMAIFGLVLAFLERSRLISLLLSLKSFPWPVLVAGGLLLVGVVLKTSQLPLNYDTGLYHAQAIRWMETYPAVPGLGNLDTRLAFNSAWLVFSALFSFSFLGWGSFHIGNGFFYFLFTLLCLTRLAPLFRGQFKASALAAGLILVISRLYLGLEWSSPGTDLPAAVLIWVIFLTALEKIEAGDTRVLDLKLASIWVLTIFVLTIKLSALPILLLPLLFLGLEGRKPLPLIAAAGILLAVPWLVRNVILSGYLIFPLPQIDLFPFDWKVPPPFAAAARDGITSWARLPGKDAQDVLALPLREWVIAWFQPLARNVKLLLLAAVLAAGFWLISNLLPNLRKRLFSSSDRLAGIIFPPIALAGILFWFVQAPDPRFGYGFLIAFVVLAFLPLVSTLVNALPPGMLLASSTVITLLVLIQLASLINSFGENELAERFVLPATYPVTALTPRKFGGFTAWMPADGTDQCWYAPLPCTPTDNPQVHLRGKTLREGFWMKLDGNNP